MSKGFKEINIRFFVLNYEAHKEVTEQEFKDAEGVIEYERHSVFTNGVKQVCLTKNNLD